MPGADDVSVVIADDFRSILDGPGRDAAAIIVDMPIGLGDTPRTRECEADARRLLGSRRSSVFSTPLRAMLAMSTFEEANDHGKRCGAGLSRQAWALTPKIRQIDDVMTAALQARVGEGHPEVAFTRIAGAPCKFSKKTPEGRRERRDILVKAGIATIDEALADLRERRPRQREFADDDFYDACVLSLTAEARLSGTAWRLGDQARDRRGLVMEIWA